MSVEARQLLQSLETQVRCPRCHLFYDNNERLPKSMPGCQHTVCLDCVYKLLAYEFWTLRCPVCAKTTELPLRNRIASIAVDHEMLKKRNLYVNLAFIQTGA